MKKELVALYRSGVSFCALDFETTGLDPMLDRIVEMAFVRFDNSGESRRFQSFCDPGIAIPPGARAIHGITDAMVASAPREREAVPALLELLGDSIVIAHNAPFDLGFLRAACLRIGAAFPDRAVFDTRLLAKAAFPSLGRYSLQHLVSALRLPQGDAHRALSDSLACMELFLACLRAFGA